MRGAQSNSDRWAALAGAAIFLLGAGFMLYRLTYVTLWSDEFRGSISTVHLPWREIVAGNYPYELNPPLYFLLLKSWEVIFGNAEPIYRGFSIAFALGSLILIFLIGKRLGNWKVGLAGMAVLALHPFFLHYATEIRPYALLSFLSLATFLFYFNFSNSESQKSWMWLIPMTFCMLCALYTHYLAVLILLGIGLLCLFNFANDRKQKWLFVIGLLILCAGVYAFSISGIFLNQLNGLVEKQRTYEFSNLLSVPAFLTGNEPYYRSENWMLLLASIVSILGGVVALIRSDKKMLAASLVTFVLISATIRIVSVEILKINLTSRYFIIPVTFVWLLFAFSVFSQHDKAARFFTAAGIFTLILLAFTQINNSVQRMYPHPDWKNLAYTIERENFTAEPIVIMGWDANPLMYYLDSPYLTSQEMEEQITNGAPAKSYLVVDSKFAAKPEYLQSAQVILDVPEKLVRLLRFRPGLATQ